MLLSLAEPISRSRVPARRNAIYEKTYQRVRSPNVRLELLLVARGPLAPRPRLPIGALRAPRHSQFQVESPC